LKTEKLGATTKELEQGTEDDPSDGLNECQHVDGIADRGGKKGPPSIEPLGLDVISRDYGVSACLKGVPGVEEL
jgi:hypothetical protein